MAAATKSRPKKDETTRGQRGELATVDEACEFLKINRVTLYRWRKKGIVPSAYVQNTVRIAWSFLEEFAKQAATTLQS